jgi:hypothetical protein
VEYSQEKVYDASEYEEFLNTLTQEYEEVDEVMKFRALEGKNVDEVLIMCDKIQAQLLVIKRIFYKIVQQRKYLGEDIY